MGLEFLPIWTPFGTTPIHPSWWVNMLCCVWDIAGTGRAFGGKLYQALLDSPHSYTLGKPNNDHQGWSEDVDGCFRFR